MEHEQDALEKLGYKNTGTLCGFTTYERPFNAIMNKNLVEKIVINTSAYRVHKAVFGPVSSRESTFHYDELLALAEIIKEMEKQK